MFFSNRELPDDDVHELRKWESARLPRYRLHNASLVRIEIHSTAIDALGYPPAGISTAPLHPSGQAISSENLLSLD